MMKIVFLSFVALSLAYGHNNKQGNDADLQSELMPQELNPFFVPSDSRPSMLSPLRLRRNTEAEVLSVPVPEVSNTMQQVKTYTRIVTGVVLGLSALVEIIVYIIETYG